MEYTDHRLAAILFTDIVGFSRMMEEDEAGTLQTLDFHNALLTEQITGHRGTVIKTIGDAFLAHFHTTVDAVQCAIAVQKSIGDYNATQKGKPLSLRIGVHVGDIYFLENDALGEGINIASRLQSVTTPGHITISREVYSQVSGKIPMRVESMGQVHLKNITREVHAYEIIPGGEDNNSNAYRKAQKEQESPEASEPRPTSSIPTRELFETRREEWRQLRSQFRQERREWKREWQAGGGPRDWKEVSDWAKNSFKDPLDELKRPDGTAASAFEIYKQKKLRRADRPGSGFMGHLIPFAAVNGFLAFVYFTFTPGIHPWFLYPLFGWGIGLISHAASAWGTAVQNRELRKIDDLSDSDLAQLREYQKARSGLAAHVASNVGVSALLLMIWSLTGAGFPWPLFPIGAMALGVWGALGRFGRLRRGILSRRKEWISDSKKRAKAGVTAGKSRGTSDEAPEVQKARQLRNAIVEQIQTMKAANPLGEDAIPTLDNYVKQIAELSTIERELGNVLVGLRPQDLERESKSLQSKIEGTSSAVLRQEYEKSLAGLEKQQKSYDDLAEQQELLQVRISGALSSLRQMQIDLARIKGLADGTSGPQLTSIKEQSDELSRYLEDYREGLKESSV